MIARFLIALACAGVAVSSSAQAVQPFSASDGDTWTAQQRRTVFQQVKAQVAARGLPTSWIDRVIADLPEVVHRSDVGKSASAKYDAWDTNEIWIELAFDPSNMSPDDINSLTHEAWHWWFDTVLTWPFSPLSRIRHWQEESVAGFIGELTETGSLSGAVRDAVGQMSDEGGSIADVVEGLYRLEVSTTGESYFGIGFADDADMSDWIKLIRTYPDLRFLEYYLPEDDRQRLEVAVERSERRRALLDAWHIENERREDAGLEPLEWTEEDEEDEESSSERPLTGDGSAVADSDDDVATGPSAERELTDVPKNARPRTGGDTDDEDEGAGRRVGPKVSRVVPGIKFAIHPEQKRQPKHRTGLIPEPDPKVYVRFQGDRNPLVQLMILDGPSTRERGPVVIPEKSALRRDVLRHLWTPLQRVASRASGRGTESAAGFSRATFTGAGQASGGAAVQMFLTATGNSSGEAFQAHFIGLASTPTEIDTSGLVIEPLKKKAREQVQKELRKLTKNNPMSLNLDAYCLEFLRKPPSAGMMFRVADTKLQEQFAPVRSVLGAARQLSDTGLLSPDTDPTQYFQSIRQWAVWTQQEGFDRAAFGDAFIGHVKKNFDAAKRPFTGDIEQALRGLVPNRWNDIEQVLNAAADVAGATDRD